MHPRLASLLFAAVATLAAVDARAVDKKPAKDGKSGGAATDSAVDAFFSAPTTTKKSALDDLQKAAADVGHKDKKDAMAPKAGQVDAEAEVKLHAVFAAEVITVDKKLGCQPGGKRRERVTYWSFEELPEIGVPFQVCLNLSSSAGRQMSMSVAVVDPRNLRVARAEDVIDFSGRSGRIDHVLEFPATTFKVAGKYVYLVEMDGKEIGRLPLFEVRVGEPAP
jgi:hypothetical protein